MAIQLKEAAVVCVIWGIMVLRMEQWFATVTITAPMTLKTAVMTMQHIAVRKDNFYFQQKYFLLSPGNAKL